MTDLFAYLDCSGPEYAWLGHFRQREFLEAGHNVDPYEDPDTAPLYFSDPDVFKQSQTQNFTREIREDRIANNPVGEAEHETTGTRQFDTEDMLHVVPGMSRTKDELNRGIGVIIGGERST